MAIDRAWIGHPRTDLAANHFALNGDLELKAASFRQHAEKLAAQRTLLLSQVFAVQARRRAADFAHIAKARGPLVKLKRAHGFIRGQQFQEFSDRRDGTRISRRRGIGQVVVAASRAVQQALNDFESFARRALVAEIEHIRAMLFKLEAERSLDEARTLTGNLPQAGSAGGSRRWVAEVLARIYWREGGAVKVNNTLAIPRRSCRGGSPLSSA